MILRSMACWLAAAPAASSNEAFCCLARPPMFVCKAAENAESAAIAGAAGGGEAGEDAFEGDWDRASCFWLTSAYGREGDFSEHPENTIKFAAIKQAVTNLMGHLFC